MEKSTVVFAVIVVLAFVVVVPHASALAFSSLHPPKKDVIQDQLHFLQPIPMAK